ncbi:neuferricin-like [Aplysia californica]|uniref:Neuferricin-like n=1 Tax=Aplysia californica TaxID=6500 RepID=A0ABM0JJB7_APLCA|nr:neuferricin-like [Aplysia californica]
MLGKLIFLSTVVCVIALLINIDYTAQYLNSKVLPTIYEVLPDFIIKNSNSSERQVEKIFSREDLLQYKGTNGGRVYLAVVGHVYDVTKGKKHYGPGGGYEFFAGIDGSKAYVTGEFNEKGLTDDISALSPSQIIGLEGWKSFYEKDYKFVGVVEGAFFDKDGSELPMMKEYRRKLDLGHQEKSLVEKDRQLFPPCNSEWSQADGGRVWCSTLSGGISRDWAGLPRMYYTAGNSKPRCACVRTTGPPSHDMNSETHKNRGDLDNPNLNVYPNCSPSSESCPLPQSS